MSGFDANLSLSLSLSRLNKWRLEYERHLRQVLFGCTCFHTNTQSRPRTHGARHELWMLQRLLTCLQPDGLHISAPYLEAVKRSSASNPLKVFLGGGGLENKQRVHSEGADSVWPQAVSIHMRARTCCCLNIHRHADPPDCASFLS